MSTGVRGPYCGTVLSRLSRSSARPIQIGRKLLQSIDAARTSADGQSPVAPNSFVVVLNEQDRAKLGDLEKPLIDELVGAAKQYASDEGYTLVGDVSVSLVTDAGMRPGKFEVRATSVAVLTEAATATPRTHRCAG